MASHGCPPRTSRTCSTDTYSQKINCRATRQAQGPCGDSLCHFYIEKPAGNCLAAVAVVRSNQLSPCWLEMSWDQLEVTSVTRGRSRWPKMEVCGKTIIIVAKHASRHFLSDTVPPMNNEAQYSHYGVTLCYIKLYDDMWCPVRPTCRDNPNSLCHVMFRNIWCSVGLVM